jgi:hypothetical protein
VQEKKAAMLVIVKFLVNEGNNEMLTGIPNEIATYTPTTWAYS